MNRDREWSVERLSVNAPRVTFYTPPQINGLKNRFGQTVPGAARRAMYNAQ